MHVNVYVFNYVGICAHPRISLYTQREGENPNGVDWLILVGIG